MSPGMMTFAAVCNEEAIGCRFAIRDFDALLPAGKTRQCRLHPTGSGRD
jgi:hypothetical protein